MRGGPIDLTPFGSLLTGIGIAYWVLALSLAGLAVWFLRGWGVKVIAAALILGGFILPVALHVKNQGQQYDAATAALDESMTLFQERCKTAGERIHCMGQNARVSFG